MNRGPLEQLSIKDLLKIRIRATIVFEMKHPRPFALFLAFRPSALWSGGGWLEVPASPSQWLGAHDLEREKVVTSL
jgi:hypothetical protein